MLIRKNSTKKSWTSFARQRRRRRKGAAGRKRRKKNAAFKRSSRSSSASRRKRRRRSRRDDGSAKRRKRVNGSAGMRTVIVEMIARRVAVGTMMRMTVQAIAAAGARTMTIAPQTDGGAMTSMTIAWMTGETFGGTTAGMSAVTTPRMIGVTTAETIAGRTAETTGGMTAVKICRTIAGATAETTARMTAEMIVVVTVLTVTVKTTEAAGMAVMAMVTAEMPEAAKTQVGTACVTTDLVIVIGTIVGTTVATNTLTTCATTAGTTVMMSAAMIDGRIAEVTNAVSTPGTSATFVVPIGVTIAAPTETIESKTDATIGGTTAGMSAATTPATTGATIATTTTCGVAIATDETVQAARPEGETTTIDGAGHRRDGKRIATTSARSQRTGMTMLRQRSWRLRR
mmetsp:Transcript_135127/g.431859  ORF Transcript_135127/g.431859 Transcript_135127/m.431859 type:complete len:400 (+) Transcript_135127:1301-2500(+)